MSDVTQRKLAAIVAADVASYSRLMAADEVATISAVRRLQHDLIAPLLDRYGGRMVKTMGDGFLMEFTSVVAGVEAAVALQRRLAAEDTAAAQTAQPLTLRIGVHLGDVVVDGADLFGDGVNVAARIEALSRLGGISLSDQAYQQVRDRLQIAWSDGGVVELKNIPRPVRIWHWDQAPDNAPPAPQPAPAETDLAAPDKPSVAVLPFDNMSDDPEHEHFADGMTEDLITDLSKISGLFVVARNSTFVYKGQAVDVPTVGSKFGVRHVIEGSVRKMGGRVRINVQLIDASNGGHVWADRFDGKLEEVFELQDDVCRQVVDALSVRLTKTETQSLGKVHTHNVEAYELYAQAKMIPYPPIPGRIAAAREMFERVVEMAPDFAGGYTGLSWVTSFDAIWGKGQVDVLGMRAETLAYKAISVDDSFGWAYTILGVALMAQRRFDEMIQAGRQGIEKLPNDADAHAFLALMLTMRGRFDEAIQEIDTAIRLSPHFINGPYLNIRCQVLMLSERYEAALASFNKNVGRGGPVGPPALAWAAGCQFALGDEAAARATVKETLLRFPDFRIGNWNLLKLIEHDADRDRLLGLFRAAGYPE